jgi:uncharacterized small protein (DUF1192 family)
MENPQLNEIQQINDRIAEIQQERVRLDAETLELWAARLAIQQAMSQPERPEA